MDLFFQLQSFIAYKWKASGPHGVHSPFVFDLITKVLIPERSFYCFADIEKERNRLLKDTRQIEVRDFGAGSRVSKGSARSIASIAAVSAQDQKNAQAIFKLAHFIGAKRMLELGTSLGIGAAYLASVHSSASLETIEGSPSIADTARDLFERLHLSNIRQHVGEFDHHISGVIQNAAPFDLVYIDGNHRFEPTLRYFNQLVDHLSPNGCIIFDDIHWSREMQAAWNHISADPRVTISIDFFRWGCIFINRDFSKEHFVLRLP